MTFSEKLIDISFDLATGQFAGGGNKAVVSGLRVAAEISNRGGAEQSFAELAIYGLDKSLMNQLSNVGNRYNKTLLNGIQILAGDSASGMSLVFAGQIYDAFVNAQDMPNVSFQVSAMPGYYYRMEPASPLSVKGAADVATMMSGIAKQMGMAFENAGVTAKLSNAYYPGTPWQQASAIAKDAGIEWFIDKNTLVIMSATKARDGVIPVISSKTGMVGYPVFNQAYVIVKALFNPDVKYGGQVTIESELTAANGTFIVQELVYGLDSKLPNGRWFMTITARVAGETTP